jgi:hypothetical protein
MKKARCGARKSPAPGFLYVGERSDGGNEDVAKVEMRVGEVADAPGKGSGFGDAFGVATPSRMA